MIEISAISAFYGKHCALDGVSLTVQRGELVVILGANGAGKTTLLKAIGGLVPVAPGGRIAMAGKELTAVPAHDIVAAGVALVPEGRGIFGEMTVRENLLLCERVVTSRSRQHALTRIGMYSVGLDAVEQGWRNSRVTSLRPAGADIAHVAGKSVDRMQNNDSAFGGTIRVGAQSIELVTIGGHKLDPLRGGAVALRKRANGLQR